MSFGFCVRRGTDLCAVSGKGVFTGNTGDAICCDNSPRFITGVPVLRELRGKSRRNFDFGYFTCLFVWYWYIYVVYYLCFSGI